ncbi:protein FAM110B-like isoform X2 [Elysia marginata]|uniref:Protein FAM110B-like isoform X2 n=1 Tax=Elysia marginata TaxID=1093978 RepID=A0AAV4HE59_9GAST|nr:protein FAM110B-like isoform X2 [Elysia marginata]
MSAIDLQKTMIVWVCLVYSDKKRQRSKDAPLSCRSKSEHNLARLSLGAGAGDENLQADIANDLNNNTRRCENSKDNEDHTGTTVALVEATRRLSLKTSSASKGPGANINNLISIHTKNRKNSSDSSRETPVSLDKQADRIVSISSSDEKTNTNISKNATSKPQLCPGKPKEKPIPPPRRRSPRILLNKTNEEKVQLSSNSEPNTAISSLDQSIHSNALESKSSYAKTCPKDQSPNPNHSPAVFKSKASLSLSAPVNTPRTAPTTKPKIPPRPRKLEARTVTQRLEEATLGDTITLDSTDSAGRRKTSLVETLTKQFTSLSASKPAKEGNCEGNSQVSSSDKAHLFKATPVYIGKCEHSANGDTFKLSPAPDSSLVGRSAPSRLKDPSITGCYCGNNVSRTSRKRCPDIAHSTDSYSKREKRSFDSNKFQKPKLQVGVKNTNELTLRDKSVAGISSPQSASKSEMSIERAEQAVSESEINAIPLATMEPENAQCCGVDEAVEGQEITRRNSSRSGRLDPGDASQSSGGSGQRHSSGGYSSSVPRSHSDISFRLGSGSGVGGIAGEGQGGQHSRDSSIVSSHSRLSRASVGADLENFFNQMGLEMGVLEPMARLRELQHSGSTGGDRALGGDTSTFGSMSSLDSQDAASICSTYSRSEHECAGTGGLSLGASGGAEGPPLATGHQQPQTSVVERNARIIKWLCNVRKAIKGGHSKTGDSGSTSTASATGKA